MTLSDTLVNLIIAIPWHAGNQGFNQVCREIDEVYMHPFKSNETSIKGVSVFVNTRNTITCMFHQSAALLIVKSVSLQFLPSAFAGGRSCLSACDVIKSFNLFWVVTGCLPNHTTAFSQPADSTRAHTSQVEVFHQLNSVEG